MPTYLLDYTLALKTKIAYVPLGTLEWHGSHLPIENDFLMSQKLCQILAKKYGGWVLPPIYLGTDIWRNNGGKWYMGMNYWFKKIMPGSTYYLRPRLFLKMVYSLVKNLEEQGFEHIYLVTGHGGKRQIEVLRKIENDNPRVSLIFPFELMSVESHHADEFELSFFWALYPEEEEKSRSFTIPPDDDYFVFKKYDPRDKASRALGEKLLQEVLVAIEQARNRF